MNDIETTTSESILTALDFEPELHCESAHISENHYCSGAATHVARVACYGTYLVCQAHVDNRRANQWGKCSCGRDTKVCWSWTPISTQEGTK